MIQRTRTITVNTRVRQTVGIMQERVFRLTPKTRQVVKVFLEQCRLGQVVTVCLTGKVGKVNDAKRKPSVARMGHEAAVVHAKLVKIETLTGKVGKRGKRT